MPGGVGDLRVQGPVVGEGEDQVGVGEEPGDQVVVGEWRVAVVGGGVEAFSGPVAVDRFVGLAVGLGPAAGQVAD
ncbi:hypothetical protein [Kitasatospora sp. NPDC088548]|uniref:hypothetical protein n=1 Tax=Kitasatospora sp. NPDC088548 TaxID=3364075 RepID=UPI0037FA36B1